MFPTTLLLVDDSQTLQQIRTARLQNLGFAVSTATDAVSALAVLERTPVAAVLLEYKLEGMDAEAVAFHIKQRFPSTPVILLSAFDDLPERVLWLVDDYVLKSEPPETIAAVVNKAACRAKKVSVRSEELLKQRQAAG
jgi:DNA-binding response OmpR family regulator